MNESLAQQIIQSNDSFEHFIYKQLKIHSIPRVSTVNISPQPSNAGEINQHPLKSTHHFAAKLERSWLSQFDLYLIEINTARDWMWNTNLYCPLMRCAGCGSVATWPVAVYIVQLYRYQSLGASDSFRWIAIDKSNGRHWNSNAFLYLKCILTSFSSQYI